MESLPLFRPAPPDVQALQEAGDIDGLIDLLSHQDPGVQEQAVRALATFGSKATRYLMGELDHTDPKARVDCARLSRGSTPTPSPVLPPVPRRA